MNEPELATPPREAPDGSHVAPSRSLAMRLVWVVAGLVLVGIGGLGVVLPGLPSTIFFIGAAACFARSNPRLERWVLQLPGIGSTVRDYRLGLGMPRRAKMVAISMIVGVSTLSGVFGFDSTTPRLILAVVCAIGVSVLLWHVPTRETVLRRGAG